MLLSIKVEMVHDLVCSWCPIGYNNISSAIEELKDELDIDFSFLPYELNPEMDELGEDIAHLMKRRMGFSTDRIASYRKNLIEVGKHCGVMFDFSKRTHYYNTLLGHRIMHWAHTVGKQKELNELLITYYFENGKDVGKESTLREALSQLGLDSNEAFDSIDSLDSKVEFNRKVAKVKNMNVTSIPTFLINDQYIVPGSNSKEFFKKTLLDIASASSTRRLKTGS